MRDGRVGCQLTAPLPPRKKGDAELSAPTNTKNVQCCTLYQRRGIHRLFFSSPWLGRLAKEKIWANGDCRAPSPCGSHPGHPLLPSSASGPAANKHFHPTHNKAKFARVSVSLATLMHLQVGHGSLAHPGLVLYCDDYFSSEPALAAPDANHRELMVASG